MIALYYIRVRKRNFFVLCNTYNIIICEPRDRSSSAGLRGTRSGLARTVWFLSADIPRTGPINNVTTVIIVSPRRRTVISCMRLCVCVCARALVCNRYAVPTTACKAPTTPFDRRGGVRGDRVPEIVSGPFRCPPHSCLSGAHTHIPCVLFFPFSRPTAPLLFARIML